METRAPGLQKLLRVFVPRGACAVPREAPHHALRCARAGQCPRGTRGGRSPPFPPSLSGILRFSFFPSERRLFFCPGGGAPVRPPGGVLRDVRPGAQGRGSVGMRLAARGRPGIAGVVPGSVTGLCPSVPGMHVDRVCIAPKTGENVRERQTKEGDRAFSARSPSGVSVWFVLHVSLSACASRRA